MIQLSTFGFWYLGKSFSTNPLQIASETCGLMQGVHSLNHIPGLCSHRMCSVYCMQQLTFYTIWSYLSHLSPLWYSNKRRKSEEGKERRLKVFVLTAFRTKQGNSKCTHVLGGWNREQEVYLEKPLIYVSSWCTINDTDASSSSIYTLALSTNSSFYN